MKAGVNRPRRPTGPTLLFTSLFWLTPFFTSLFTILFTILFTGLFTGEMAFTFLLTPQIAYSRVGYPTTRHCLVLPDGQPASLTP